MALHPEFPKSSSASPYYYAAHGRYTMAVKVIDIFGNDTMTRMPVTVG